MQRSVDMYTFVRGHGHLKIVIADTDAETDMNYLKNSGHGADKPRTCVSTDL